MIISQEEMLPCALKGTHLHMYSEFKGPQELDSYAALNLHRLSKLRALLL